MKAKLFSHTQDAEGRSLMEQVAYVARVSNPANQANNDTADRLISYLIKHHHWSPFEMVSACLEIQTTRDIARQMLRHRSFTFQEFSQRYAEATEAPVYREARMQDMTNRQNSTDTADEGLQIQWAREQRAVHAAAGRAYAWALGRGIAKEVARAVLPEGITQSRLYMSGTLRSWIHYIQLRTGPETQREHRAVALACAEALAGVFPMIVGVANVD